jgi:two-component system, OmpR family, sensor histidine kinase KdpD
MMAPAVPPVPTSHRVIRNHYLQALAICGLTALIATPLRDRLDLANSVMLFLLSVVLVAVRLGRGPAIFAAFCSVALFDFFFVQPRLSFAVHDVQYLITFAVMLAVALIISHLTAGLAREAHAAEARELQTRSLYELAKALAGALSQTQVLEAVASFLRENLRAETLLLLPDAQNNRLHSISAPASTISPAAETSVQSVYDSGEIIEAADISAGKGVSLLLPLRGSTRMRGVLVVTVNDDERELLQQQRSLLIAVASLMAIAIERLHFVEVAQNSQLQVTSERLRTSILSALSHDVRTPLTVMYGLSDTLARSKPPLPASAQETVLTIREQALRLNNMVGNLLDMARLQAGQVRLRKEWQPLEEVIGASIKMLGTGLQGHAVKVSLPADLPMLEFDAVLMERVFCNLLENAAKYSPDAADINVSAQVIDAMIEITVCNTGAGFPPDSLARIFELFERGSVESAVHGFGIGLAICRAIVEAHGGSIRAFNPESGGACVGFTLPRGTPPQIESESDMGETQ